MLHEIAASDLDITHIVNPIRKLLKRMMFLHGEVESIDLASKRAAVFHGPNRHHHELSYDYLVIALGTTTNFYQIPGLEERALTMKSWGAVGLTVGPIVGLIVGLIGGLGVGSLNRITLVETLSWRWN
jgi:NADH dehydrogenase FAD-containing subunit